MNQFSETVPEKARPQCDAAIDRVMSGFDFEAVHIAMTALGWKWSIPFAGQGMEIPSIYRLKEQARLLLQDAWDEPNPESECSIGGFRAFRTISSLHLEFVLREI